MSAANLGTPVSVETRLPRSTPQAEQLDSSAISKFIELAEKEQFNTHSLMIVRHGKVVFETWWEPFRREENHLLYSLTKSFASTAVGFAISEEHFGLDDFIIDLLPEQTPTEPSANLSKMKVRHLLSMSVGHEIEPTLNVADGNWGSCSKLFLAHPVPHEPGTHFLYNTAASNMLSILIQKTSGEPLDAFLRRRLFNELGIVDEKWTRGRDFVWGGSGLYTTTESIAKLGLLYLDSGKWQTRQLLPLGWAETATSFQVNNGSEPDNDWNQGYGFQFWRCRHNAFRGDGAFGQFCLVVPEKQAVVAITSGDSDMQKVLNAVWNILLPAFDAGGFEVETSLPGTRSLGPTSIDFGHPAAIRLSNKAKGFALSLEGATGTLEYFGKIPLSLTDWVEFDYSFGRKTTKTARARAGWIRPDCVQVSIWDPSSPQNQTFTIETNGSVAFEESGVFDALPTTRFRAE